METIEIIALVMATLIAVKSGLVFRKSMHMLQLNSYKNGIHLRWLWDNDILFSFKRVKTKKPLVYTHRVVRMCVTSGVMFFAVCAVFMRFALPVTFRTVIFLPIFLFFAELLPIIANIINAPIEKANNGRYIREAKAIIDARPDLITVGITGSYGKTSTKYFLHKLLSAKFDTLMTPESYNTTLGVVKTIRGELRPTHEVFVCEMGMMWKGDIAELCEIAKPKHAVLTSIGPQHLETMKSLENIIEEKFSITEPITDGKVFLNYDNEHIRARESDMAGKNKNVVRYGLTEFAGDYRAVDISVSEKGTTFTVGETKYETALLGEHNVQNIVGAIAVANTLGIPMKELVLPVKRLEAVPHRLQIKTTGDTVIIDDAFNSNPVGAKAALDVLALMGECTDGTRILITPGMVELGEKMHELNKAFGAQAAASCDYAVLIGQKQAPPIKAGLAEAGFPEEKIRVFDSFDEGMAFANELESEKGKKKIILLENDLPDNY
jgi:UDP-N-acetylmuramoyl-tripeptide--D-alanyl-D-alanine ligase